MPQTGRIHGQYHRLPDMALSDVPAQKDMRWKIIGGRLLILPVFLPHPLWSRAVEVVLILFFLILPFFLVAALGTVSGLLISVILAIVILMLDHLLSAWVKTKKHLMLDRTTKCVYLPRNGRGYDCIAYEEMGWVLPGAEAATQGGLYFFQPGKQGYIDRTPNPHKSNFDIYSELFCLYPESTPPDTVRQRLKFIQQFMEGASQANENPAAWSFASKRYLSATPPHPTWSKKGQTWVARSSLLQNTDSSTD